MKIGFITTLNTNIGDDLIREGIINILNEIRKGQRIKFVYVNKHKPNELYNKYHPSNFFSFIKRVRGGHYIYKIIEKIFSIPLFSKFYACDLIIQSGAPVLWPDCHLNEWSKPIWYNTIGKIYKKRKILNLAAGSSYPYENYPEKIENENDIVYLRDISSFCTLTTVRDNLSKNLLDKIGIFSINLPCTAFFSSSKMINEENAKTIYINYMEGGGHFDWNQEVNKLVWQKTIESVVKELKESFPIKFLCHNEREKELAEKLFNGFEIVYPKTKIEYFELISDARIGIFNRMHASVAFASFGVPSIAIGTDSRIEMVKNIDLPAYYVKEAELNLILKDVLTINKEWGKYNNRLKDLKKDTFQKYIQLLKNYVVEKN
jgi:polysaccharide pyruvyl transferase WcaK-like protein